MELHHYGDYLIRFNPVTGETWKLVCDKWCLFMADDIIKGAQ